MTILIREEQEGVFGTKWFEMSSYDTDIYSIYTGLKAPDKEGIIWDNFVRYSLCADDVPKFYSFIENSNPQDTLVLDDPYEGPLRTIRLSILSFDDYFCIDIYEETRKKGLFGTRFDWSQTYAYDVNRDTLLELAVKVKERYLSQTY